MNKLFAAIAVTIATAAPALAAPEAAVVLQYRLPDGSMKSLLFTAPDGLSLSDCQSTYKQQLPTFKRQVEAMNIPEFAGAEYVSASCEPYSEDLLN
ncbi:hypothetical protein [Devosia sp. RR2S18]|jgi:hypothetical protein|uniref:hypothetical protein n=1 Tax=Devosia rhizosphaerae TaxID=3049774 RepID=UPI002540C224|nr:hypothetical protein [Devosia sp. RR2S18]WIJ25728.1 hypothetical protein QOV41_02890 [Devosia sp. RR2S18]HEV7291087.1 hypothetical protein [Devosia sp.]